MHLSPQEFFTGLLTICLVNLVLSGDNAVVIALASRNLPPKQRKTAIIWGSAAAIALRVGLTIVAVIILQIPFLRTAGGALLVYIGVKLLIDSDEGDSAVDASSNIMAAIKTIVIADLIMSLDNVLAVAAASKGHILLLILGLVISVPIIIAGSQLLVWVMAKIPILVYVGAGLIAYTAGEMINGDRRVAPLLYNYAGHDDKLAVLFDIPVRELQNQAIPSSALKIPASYDWALPVILIIVVCGLGWYLDRRRKRGKAGSGQKEGAPA